MEKSVVTPDQYPMTLNGLTNACNQKSSRHPVMNLEPGEVLRTVRSLKDKHLLRIEENFKTQVEKYTQRLCNTPFSDFQFDPPQYAVMTVLLLRGPRTPGELKANAGRLHTFADNADVLATLKSLIDREGGPVVAELPRTPGRRDSEYAHLLSGEIDLSARPVAAPAPRSAAAAGRPDLEARIAALEAEVAELKRQLGTL